MLDESSREKYTFDVKNKRFHRNCLLVLSSSCYVIEDWGYGGVFKNAGD